MFTRFRMRRSHFLESIQENGWKHTFQEMVYFRHRQAILMSVELDSLQPLKENKRQEGLELIAIEKKNVGSMSLNWPLQHRHLKMLSNVDKGYRGYVLVRDGTVLGDIWCAFSTPDNPSVHPDIGLLQIDCGPQDVYGFDMYIPRRERGNSSLAGFLFGGALHDLKQMGFEKMLCYVMADRTPAVWLHRMLGFKELHRCELMRFLCFKSVKRIA